MLADLAVHKIGEEVRSGRISPREIVKSYVNKIKESDAKLNSILYFDEQNLEDQLTALDQRLKVEPGSLPLAGVPILIKDSICTRDMPTTCGSLILKDYRPPYDATAVRRLRDAGAIILGKANCDEFAMGSSNENSAYGPVANPWNEKCVAGGSSGGSAAAVSAGLCSAALGSDTGGSIRLPASFCGVVGLKTTYGRVSRYGLVAYGSSLDQIGPMTRNVLDAALIYDVIAGHDPLDSTSLDDIEQPGFPRLTKGTDQRKPLSGKKIGFIKEFHGEGLGPEIDSEVKRILKICEAEGAEIREISLPKIEYSIASYYVLATAEASANLARFDGVRFGFRADDVTDLRSMYAETRSKGFGREVKQRIMLGTFVLSQGYYDQYYAKACLARQVISDEFVRAFLEVNMIIAPVAPTAAFKIGEKIDDPIAMYFSDIYTIPVNLAGIPSLAIPTCLSSAGLPLGIQIIGPKHGEANIFHLGLVLERVLDFAAKAKHRGA